MRDLDLPRAAKRLGAVAPVSGWRRRVGIRLRPRRWLPSSSASSSTALVFSVLRGRTSIAAMACKALLELVVIGLAQRRLPRSVQHPVQFVQVHIDAAPSGGLHPTAPEQFAKPLRQRISQNLFDRPVRHVAVGLLAASRRLAQQHPVGRAVTGSAESLRIHERLQKVNRMPVHPLPVVGDPRRHAAQNVRRQVLHPHPRQNQESRVVGDESGCCGGALPRSSRCSGRDCANVARALEDHARQATGRPCAHTRYFRCSPTGCS